MRIYLDNCCFNRPFDYTKWQRKLWAEKTIDEISSSAMRSRKEVWGDSATEPNNDVQ